jgi:hypothetical protein
MDALIERHLTDDHWRVVLVLTASMLDNADGFFERFAAGLDERVRPHTALVRLLRWVQERVARGGWKREPVQERSLSLYYLLDLARARDETAIRVLREVLAASRLYVECLDVAYISDRAALRDRLLRAPKT